ncbi:CelD/BcsL family acetyltransferase involved in cellulose biosynthesis [Sinorhizobium kostiense]|uniref:CelD/BcsL family acetyltransferase involved in cellulose biosynthesis n=1 Tax=Sinorhizobium kostiense TaxID=76747 RepID=A0ABS4QW79_9HYPH|nr:GNAT family N-acetyltransferase [Sinorhizobium kostiense]MBP2234898.1 CelD/BcsL family acetyltransferase involved in cellulose biosynthesis [Sinorhizobium kostiense]
MAHSDFILAPPNDASLNPHQSVGRDKANRITVSIHSGLSENEAEWRTLEANNLNSPHQSLDWCRTWEETHDRQVLVVRGAIGGQALFVLPFEIVRGCFFRTARLIGSDHSNLNTGLFAEGIEMFAGADLTRALTDGLRQIRGFADVVSLDRIPATWRGAPHPLHFLPGAASPNASFQLPLRDDIEQTLAQLNAKRRRKRMRISEKRLAEFGGYEYVIARQPSEAHSLLEIFFRQKAARFAKLGLPDVFADGATRAFFHTLIDRGGLFELNAIRMRGEHHGKILAVAGLLRKGDHVICQFGSIDETVAADSSPGELLFYRIIERLCGEGVKVFDFGIGDQSYKRSWCTIETPLRDIVLPLTPRGQLAAGIHRMIARAKRAAKANEPVYTFLQRQRRRWQ